MQCPIDGSTLVMSDKQGIEIDYCPQCRGVWLDRGEIDKIVERSVGGPAPVAAAPASHAAQPQHQGTIRRDYDDDDHHDNYRHDNHHGGHNQHKRKESWLGDLFD